MAARGATVSPDRSPAGNAAVDGGGVSSRLFIGLWPGPVARAGTVAQRDAWAWGAKSRTMRPDQFHLTLHFLGNLPRERLPGLIEAIALPFEPFALMLEQPELWPRGIAVLCPRQLPPALLRLHAALGEALVRFGLPVDARPWRPHVTLARAAEGAVPPAVTAPMRWSLRSYALAESLAGPPRRYRLLQRYR